MTIKRINGEFSVCKLRDYSEVDLNAKYCFVGKTDEEHSLVCLTTDVPEHVLEREDGWRAFRCAGFFTHRNTRAHIGASGGAEHRDFCCFDLSDGLYFNKKGAV